MIGAEYLQLFDLMIPYLILSTAKADPTPLLTSLDHIFETFITMVYKRRNNTMLLRRREFIRHIYL